jgi:protoheme IX farnesyltransferase
VGYLALTLPRPAAAADAALTIICYVAVYTPLKWHTTLNTLIGAVPGALPPVIGWSAASGEITGGAVALFLILFVWQVPHFLAIAWIYRDEYRRAGLCMLPVVDRDGTVTARNMILYCLTLIPVSLFPVLLGSAGPVYFAGAVLLGVGFLAPALGFRRHKSVAQARRVLRASLLYLPGLLALLVLDGALPALIAR